MHRQKPKENPVYNKDSSEKELCAYDEVPYESLPFRHSHLDRMAVVAALFGMTPAPVQSCRVLEIGSASGGNIIPMAATYPDSQFLGIDLSSRQVDDGKAVVEEIGLKNIEIRRQNIMDFPDDSGNFDYIICHGVYSWVPDFVQAKIMRICQEKLDPNGVAYISYNVYPGWSFHGAVRNMMLYRTRAEKDPSLKLSQAKALVDFLGRAAKLFSNAETGTYAIKPYELLLAEEAQFLQKLRADYLLHEYLADANEPLYFWQFVERANDFGLKYLSEAEYCTSRPSNFAKEIQDELNKLSSNILDLEQYMDFVRNRTFRQTLLCRKEVKLSRETSFDADKDPVSKSDVNLDSIREFYVASPAKPAAGVNLQSREPESFALEGRTFTTPRPLVKAAFQYLAEIWPRSTSFNELLIVARSRVAPALIQEASAAERDCQLLASDLLLAYGGKLLQFRFAPDSFVTEISERPKASATARYQAKKNMVRVTNQLHELFESDSLSRHVMNLLDGTKNRDEVLDELSKLVQNGTLVIYKDGKQLVEGDVMVEVLKQHLNDCLPRLANASLLIVSGGM